MGITAVINSSVNSSALNTAAAAKPVNTQPEINTANNNQDDGTTANNNQPGEQEIKKVTDELNDFMESINTDIKFVLHNKTDELMIQVEDSKTHRVLKEFPPHELLDRIAKIRDCIGAFLDEQA